MDAVSEALGIPVEDRVGRTGPTRDDAANGPGSDPAAVERAIRQEHRLSTAQKEALISVFHGFLEPGAQPGGDSAAQ